MSQPTPEPVSQPLSQTTPETESTLEPEVHTIIMEGKKITNVLNPDTTDCCGKKVRRKIPTNTTDTPDTNPPKEVLIQGVPVSVYLKKKRVLSADEKELGNLLPKFESDDVSQIPNYLKKNILSDDSDELKVKNVNPDESDKNKFDPGSGFFNAVNELSKK